MPAQGNKAEFYHGIPPEDINQMERSHFSIEIIVFHIWLSHKS